MRMDRGMKRKAKTTAVVLAVAAVLLAVSIPLQYLARTEVVAGLAPGSAHAHAHGEGEEAHEHEHEHPDEEGHLAAEVPLGVNLIPNYGFEVGTRERIPGWVRIADEQGGLTYRDDSTSYRGLASAAVAVITLFWKASAHCAVAGHAAAAGSLALGALGFVFLLVLPLVVWSRVAPTAHTLAQALAGASVGGVFALLLLF